MELFKFWPFPLSDFQKWALYALLNKKHVLITAHTGSGKTVPAEGAIEYFTKLGKRIIYTSPIKALTNQKFHGFFINPLVDRQEDFTYCFYMADGRFW